MESAYWSPAHCAALKQYVAKGLSYADAAEALNARFGTAYSRNSALGRARRMRLAEAEGPEAAPVPREAQLPPLRACRTADDRRPREFFRRPPAFGRVDRTPLRCVEIEPRHLTLPELEGSECRYPYGGDADGEAITFCGHRRRKGSSYCTPHFHLTRNPEVATARTVSVAPLRLVMRSEVYPKTEGVLNESQETPESV